MAKPKVAFFDFACCEGCQLQIANIGELLLDVLGLIDVVEFREVMSEKGPDKIDVAIVEGSITDKHAIERIKKIRERASVLIAYGACACTGGVNGMKNNFKLEDIRKEVYGDRFNYFDTVETKAVHQVVKVDYFVNGCPVYIPEFVKVLKCALQGLPYEVPDQSVCTECKLNENVCMYERGVTCLGPVTKAGCNSWCINNGNICYGCRGMVSNPNEKGAQDVIKKYNVPMDLVMNKMNMYNKCRENDKK
ncbi:cytochrome B [candidate division WOR-1 bacterium RIFOXYB2_FULL_42_35]|uniref:Cytochrome B n=1 Tax=candidate division WOR-1 bacterium RIFOXYC2_FULL_41_25 TaxID=1802586 RepID=A0A1F4TN68_UNCSA|nr:MAG: cytochrome B [candidate division WOR-1 bacterium RIFOXYA2_FULL_41_14]OGC24657.1 MAG: cytochrome B [candidate division WOR-1 bacterium RIFOXYB2_FULL_42_35]OGC34172.1 MAG: cytochrome B [candidate division WOR-1 bacterium RIFOXYC2_FULL_41_25]OGC42265.1 MAG: cytochrome B [candidate division WOR-1 bacterium RIFOXYD2_FULL_41_8]